jgi:hypothetical protein
MGLSFRRSKVFRKSLIDLKILLNPHITSEIPITKINFSKKNFHCECSKRYLESFCRPILEEKCGRYYGALYVKP